MKINKRKIKMVWRQKLTKISSFLVWENLQAHFSKSVRSTRKLQKLKCQIIQKEVPIKKRRVLKKNDFFQLQFNKLKKKVGNNAQLERLLVAMKLRTKKTRRGRKISAEENYLQKQANIFYRLLFSKHGMAATLVFIMLLLIGFGTFILLNDHRTDAASNSWVQTDWAGGADTVNAPTHTSNKTGWTKYYSKQSVDTTNAELKLDRGTN